MTKSEDFEQQKYEEEFEKAWDETNIEFEELKKEKLIISLFGTVNVGKSMTINALTGIDYAEVKARAGSTKKITLYELTNNVFIADTPGLNDINEEISRKASDFIQDDSDIILFFLNATVGITKNEKDAFNEIIKLRKEIIIVINKIDALDHNDLEEVENQIFEELNLKPVPISARNNIGIEELHERILKVLKDKGKDLLFLKASKYKEKQVSNWINAATAGAFGIGALPIPGSDIVGLTFLQVGLARKIAFIWNCKVEKSEIMQLIATTVTGTVGRQLVRLAITALKALGWIPGAQLVEAAAIAIAAAIAAGITYAFGWTCNAYYKSGMSIELDDLGIIFEEYYKEYERSKKDDK